MEPCLRIATCSPQWRKESRLELVERGGVRRLSMCSAAASRQSPSRGLGVLELVIALPVLVLTLVAAIQFASVLAVNSSLSAAANEAARRAAMRCTEDQIEAGVSAFLDVHGVTLGPGARLVVLDEAGIVLSLGNPALTGDCLASLPPAGMVTAVLLVSSDATPIPNALANYCVDYSGRQYELCATASLQCFECDT